MSLATKGLTDGPFLGRSALKVEYGDQKPSL